MNDRLQDLYSVRTSNDFMEAEPIDVPIDVDKLEVPAGLQEFSSEVDKVKLGIAELKSCIDTLSAGYKAVLLATSDASLQEEANRATEQKIEGMIKGIADRLKKMATDNETATIHNRWRSNVHSHLTKRFMDDMLQYRGLQSDHRERVQQRIRQRLQIVKPDATDEEIQQVMDGGKMNVFAEQLNKENLIQARDALTYVEGRHRELVKIENSVNELHQLFCDMAILVQTQGSMIDNIEMNVGNSKAYVEQGNKDLIKANKSASKRRWCKLWLCIICLILLGVGIAVFIGLGASNGWWKKATPI